MLTCLAQNAYHRVAEKVIHEDVKIRPDRLYVNATTAVYWMEVDVEQCLQNIGVLTAQVDIHLNSERRTSDHLATHPSWSTKLPTPVAVTVSVWRCRQDQHNGIACMAFINLVRAQPENAERLFTQKRSKENVQLSYVVDSLMCLELMQRWANDFYVDGDGGCCKARLVGGAEVFAAYLDNQPINSKEEIDEAEAVLLTARRE